MRPSFPAALSCAAACALFVTAGVAFQAAPQAPPPAGSQSSAPAAPTAPAQFPPLGTGVSPEERATLQSAVDQLATRVTALKVKYRSGAMADRVADVEVYLDAVRRPLKYDERLYAPKGSAPAATALQTLATGTERAEQLARGTTPWMTVSGVRGFYSRIDGSAQPYILTMPDNYDAAGQAAVPARSLPARPRRHRARAAVHDEVDDGLHVEAARPWRRSLHAAAVQPLHKCEPLRRRN